MASSVRPGDVISDRFVLEHHVASGGMGAVWRARDRTDGDRAVAIKLVAVPSDEHARRFAREIDALRRLEHPGIVRLVAYDLAGGATPWLAMEWLDGEDLAARLRRGPLDVASALDLVERVSHTLAFAHARGLVHRDLKPANLFLVGGDTASPKLLDFGLARGAELRTTITASGTMLGTPGYMAPEQARGEPDVDARADVFSLGCVLYECLTGRAAFAGAHVMAVLVKVLLEPAPRASEVTPGIPDALDALVNAMLAKERDGRPADASALAAALSALRRGSWPSAARRGSSDALSSRERRRVALVLAWHGAGPDLDDPAARTVLDPSELRRRLASSSDGAAREAGVRIDRLADGAALAVIGGTGSAADLAARAARTALRLRAQLGGVPIVVATGEAELSERELVGRVIDDAVARLRALEARHRGARIASPVEVDDVTARLLDERFVVRALEGGHFVLDGERSPDLGLAHAPSRRIAPCVGRDRELAALEAVFVECFEERSPRVARVVGAAGLGKTRIARELLARLDASAPSPRVWAARSEEPSAGSALTVVAQLVRRATGLRDADAPTTARAALDAHVSALLGAEHPDVGAVAETLAEVAGIAIAEPSPRLRMARREASVMAESVRYAWEALCGAAATRQPLLLVLDDLHWGDSASTRLIEGALRRNPRAPIGVLVLARPEIDAVLPGVFAEQARLEHRLGPLTRRAAEELARRVLGDGAEESAVQAVAERSGGHPFFVEELARAVRDGKRDVLPETVLATLELRIEQVSPESRRALRAAAILGERFWTEAVAELLGSTDAVATALLDDLARDELVDRRPPEESRFAGRVELAFRHALVRDAALALLTEDDRKLGHRLAAQWLERAGERDPLAVGSHHEQAGDGERAAECLVRAAEGALAAGDLGGALAHAARAVVLGASGVQLGRARLVEAEVHRWRHEPGLRAERAEQAATLLPWASDAWLRAATQASIGRAYLGDVERSDEWVRRVLAARHEGSPASMVHALSLLGYSCVIWRRMERSRDLISSADALRTSSTVTDPVALAWYAMARGAAANLDRRPDEQLSWFRAAHGLFEQAGDLRGEVFAGACSGAAWNAAGRGQVGLHGVLRMLDRAESLGLVLVVRSYRAIVAEAAARMNDRAEVERQVAALAGAGARSGPVPELARARAWLALVCVAQGDLASAIPEAEAAFEASRGQTGTLAAHVALAEVRLAEDRPQDALTIVEEANALLRARGADDMATYVHWVRARALDAVGRTEESLALLAEQRESLLAAAARIEDETLRRSWTENLAEHRGLLDLATARSGPGPAAPATS
ncbi:MAG: protein kinase [Deltaproteobacteria bacterium]|nr:protein kinase [Deltaproteobacteria bacterium]